jgi:uncharacterized protein (TIGR00251 family)
VFRDGAAASGSRLNSYCHHPGMITITDHLEGVVLNVRAQPGASRGGLRGEQRGSLRVAVTQVAEKGKANQALIEVLAECLRLKRSQLEWLAGLTQRDKRLLVRGVSRDELAQRIEAALGK